MDRVDKIFMTGRDIQKLDNWWINIHEGAFNEFSPVLEEGLIIQTFYNESDLGMINEFNKNRPMSSKETRLYFKQINDDTVYYEVYRKRLDNNELEWLIKVTRYFSINKSNVEINRFNKIGLNKENVMPYVDKVTTVHIALMNYMEMYQDVKGLVKQETVRTIKSKKSKHGKKKSARPIVYTKYVVDISDKPVSEEDKRKYSKMKESWGVRGHWRKLKDGKEVWIKPYVKGDKDKKEPEVYKFN